jgi:catechol 2,3-dioxygenase-like lactoylglutathione lyase family enzyme
MTHLALHVRDLAACIDFYQDYCGMAVIHERGSPDDGTRIVWLAEPGRRHDFIFVLLPGGPGRDQADGDYSHFGFALDSRAAVDRIAARARAAGCLAWEPRDEPYPVGYYCGLRDPDGNFVEFSFGQPLGPGTEADDSSLSLTPRGQENPG